MIHFPANLYLCYLHPQQIIHHPGLSMYNCHCNHYIVLLHIVYDREAFIQVLCRNCHHNKPWNLSPASSSYHYTWKATNTVLHKHEWLFTPPNLPSHNKRLYTRHRSYWGLFPVVIKAVHYLNSSNFLLLVSISDHVFSFVVCPINLVRGRRKKCHWKKLI